MYTVSIISDDEKVRFKMNCYILHMFDHITFYNRHYLQSLHKIQIKTKQYQHSNKLNMENNEIKRAGVKNRTCYNFDDIIKTEDFNFYNIS